MEDISGLVRRHIEFKEKMAQDGWINCGQIMLPGVYFLLCGTEVIYIGKSDCMLVRIYSHVTASNSKRKSGIRYSAVAGVKFDGLRIMPLAKDRLADVEREMIRKYRPKYNQRMKPAGPKQSLPPSIVARIMEQRAMIPQGFRRRA